MSNPQDTSYSFPSTLHLLHVEDSREIILLVSTLLSGIDKFAIQTDTACTLKEALVLLKQKKFDAVLLDLLLPDSYGVETLLSILKVAPKLPVIIVTGSDSDELILRAIRAGAQDFLVKNHLSSELLKRTLVSAIDRKQIQDALQESEERLKYALEASNDGFWDWDVGSGRFYFSPRFETILGYTPGELNPSLALWQELIHPGDKENSQQQLQAHLDNKIPLYVTEYRVLSKTGEWLWISCRGKVVDRNEHGHALRVSGIHTDITDRKKSEQALKQSQERFQLAVDGSNDGIWDWPDITQDDQYWSPRFKELLGYAEDEIQASLSTFWEMLHPDDRNQVSRIIEDHKTIHEPFNIEYRQRTKDGSYHWFRARGRATLNNGSESSIRITGSISDVTLFKKSQEEKNLIEIQLRQAQKLEAIGQLAAGVAHEINTPIQFISDNIQFLQESFSELRKIIIPCKRLLQQAIEDHYQPNIVQDIQKLCETLDLDYLIEEIPTAITQSREGTSRVSSIVKAMKEFSHPGTTDKKLADINKAIQNTIIVSRNEWKYTADMETDLDPDLPMIECLPGELNQVILNIIVNAAHAIGETQKEEDTAHGKITIKTRKANDYIEILISDTGAGIPQEIQSRIFEPFFTTKPIGKGTGQGLAIAYSVIVDKHQGKISLQSKPGEGTVFCISLPIQSISLQEEDHYEKMRAVC